MPFGKEPVEFQGLIGCLLHEQKRGLDNAGREAWLGHEPLRVCQACIRRGKRGIALDNLLEQFSRCPGVVFASPAHQCARLEIENIGIDTDVVPPLARTKRQSKLVDNRPRDFTPDGEEVVEFSIEALGPQRNIPRDLNQWDEGHAWT